MKTSNFGYFQSLAEELHSQSLRVRQLIGDAHWGHDGRHKELLLQHLVRRHCPSTVLVSTGFVVSPTNPETRSKEQDLLIIDTSTEAPLFHQGDLVVAFPHTVLAAISIKSTMDDGEVKSVIDGLASVRQTARDCNCAPHRIWCGGFFYSVSEAWQKDPTKMYHSLQTHIRANPAPKPLVDKGLPHASGPDLLADAKDYAYLIDYASSTVPNMSKIRGYNCQGIATAVFLSCLIEHMTVHFGRGHSTFTDVLLQRNMLTLTPPSFALVT